MHRSHPLPGWGCYFILDKKLTPVDAFLPMVALLLSKSESSKNKTLCILAVGASFA
jgi:hypothetical protein